LITPFVMALEFHGSDNLRMRLVLSTLTGIPIRVKGIREDEMERPGLSPAEVGLLRLLEKVTDGTKIEINETGTSLRFRPGILVGSPPYEGPMVHDCSVADRTMTYFAEVLLMLAPFVRSPLQVVLRGSSEGKREDITVDSLMNIGVPLLRKLTGVDVALQLVRRGMFPKGGGEIKLVTKNVLTIAGFKAIDLVEPGRVKRIRGVAFSSRVSPMFVNTMVDVTRGVLNDFTADVYIYTDHEKGKRGSDEPGFGMTLVAESDSHCLVGADCTSTPPAKDPEEVAKSCLNLFLEEISYGGCVDTSFQGLLILMMALAEEDISRARIGRLSTHSVSLLRDIRQFTGVMFKIRPDRKTETVLLSCVGSRLGNVAKVRF